MNSFQEKFVQNTTYMGKYYSAEEMPTAVHARMCIIPLTFGNVIQLMLSITYKLNNKKNCFSKLKELNKNPISPFSY